MRLECRGDAGGYGINLTRKAKPLTQEKIMDLPNTDALAAMTDMEQARHSLTQEINSQIESDDEDQERSRLQEEYGQVWDTKELGNDFEVLGFMAPFIAVRRRSDGEEGSLEFQHSPRLYFNWLSDK